MAGKIIDEPCQRCGGTFVLDALDGDLVCIACGRSYASQQRAHRELLAALEVEAATMPANDDGTKKQRRRQPSHGKVKL